MTEQPARSTPAETEEARCDRLLAGLQAELTPDQYERVVQAVQAMDTSASDSLTDELHALVEGIAAHFGPLAPLVRAVAHHVHAPRDEQCRDNCSHPWPMCGAHYWPEASD